MRGGGEAGRRGPRQVSTVRFPALNQLLLEVPFLCPNCRSNRVAPAHGPIDWLFRIFGREPFRCQMCSARFFSNPKRRVAGSLPGGRDRAGEREERWYPGKLDRGPDRSCWCRSLRWSPNIYSALELVDVLFLLPSGRPRFLGGSTIHASGFPRPRPRLLISSSMLEIVF